MVLADELRPDLTLMDIQLEGEIDGVKAAEQIRHQFSLPVVFLTAHTDESTLQRAKLAEPYGYLLKPLQDRELKSTIELALYKHRMEESLRESEERYRSLLHDMLEGYAHCQMIYDAQGQPIDFIYLNVNRAFEQLTGLSNVAGKLVTEVIPNIKTSNPEIFETYDRVIKTGKPEKFEVELRTLHRWLSISATKDKDNCFSVIFDDISARKRAENARLESERRFAAFFHANLISAAISRVDDGMFIDANDAFLNLFGYTRNEVLGHTSLELRLWPVPEERDILIKTLKEQGRVRDLSVRFRHKSGETGDVLVAAEFIEINSEQYMFGMLLDITERKRVEQELQNLSNQQRIILDTSAIGIGYVKNRRIQWANPTHDAIFGFERGESVGMDTSSFYASALEYERIGKEGYKQLAQGGVYSTELELKKKDGSMFWCSLMGQALNPSKLEEGAIWVLKDISERKRIEAERRQWEQKEQRLQKAESLARMAGAIAHHFNNHLQVVMMNLNMTLADLPNNTELAENLNFAMQSARKAAEVSTRMVAYLGQTHSQRETLDLAESCQRNLPLLLAAMPQNVVLETHISSPGPAVLANPQQLQQILTNLVHNAQEAYLSKNGIVHLRVKTVASANIPSSHRFPIDFQPQCAAYACLEVADQGCGIAEQDIEKIFDPFFSTKFTGRGMGLAVVHGITREHLGVITVESRPGVGSIFRVYLPLSTKRETELQASAATFVR
jgi:PAS domain S-box-containing protein